MSLAITTGMVTLIITTTEAGTTTTVVSIFIGPNLVIATVTGITAIVIIAITDTTITDTTADLGGPGTPVVSAGCEA